jgi:hypothetical protein
MVAKALSRKKLSFSRAKATLRALKVQVVAKRGSGFGASYYGGLRRDILAGRFFPQTKSEARLANKIANATLA